MMIQTLLSDGESNMRKDGCLKETSSSVILRLRRNSTSTSFNNVNVLKRYPKHLDNAKEENEPVLGF